MQKRVDIPNPCGENISAMTPCASGKHCGVCKRDLLDLRKKDLDTVNRVLEENPGACVIVETRHTTAGKNVFYSAINRFESFLRKYKMAALASVLIPIFLFLSGCHSRKPHFVGKFKHEMPVEKEPRE